MQVLIAVDGSEGSFEAVRQIGPLLLPERDEVALYCHPPQLLDRSGQATSQTLESARESMANAIFAEARKRLPSEFRKVSTIIGQQDPKRGIIIAAEQFSAGLVVMGARGLGPFQRLVLGSVSQTVVHACRIPVWVARRKPGELPWGSRVLLAHSKPEANKPSMDLLSQLHWPENTLSTFLSVIPSMFAGNIPEWMQQQARESYVDSSGQRWAEEHEEDVREHLVQLRSYAGNLPTPFNRARCSVVEGDPAREILATIARESTDLAVIGAQGNRPLIGAWLGSTANAVLNHAECSVLVVPSPESP